jgi:hypothetical protein
MRSHAPTTRSKHAAGLARARMLMKAKLGWLGGHPCPTGWIVVPEDERPVERLVLGRDHLRRATYTANKLRGEFPRALPKLVGDVDAWHAAVTAVLATLKPWVHHGQPPPPELFESELHTRAARARARALRQQHPALRGLVDAVSWVLATRAAAAPKALAWIEREAAALEGLHACMDPATSDPLGIQLVHLALALGPKAVAPLVRLLGEPAGHRVPTHGGAEHSKQAQSAIEHEGRQLPPEPSVQLPAALVDAVRWLLTQDPATAKRWLALLERCDPVPLLFAWAQWWPPLRKLASSGHAIRNHEDESPARKQRLAALRRQLLAHRELMPGELPLRLLIDALAPLAEPGFEAAHAAACRVLGRLPGPELVILRASLVLDWSTLHATPSPWWIPRRMPQLLRAFDEHLRARPVTPTRLAPWVSDARSFAARGRGGHALQQDLLEDDLEVADIGRFFQALRWLETHEPEIELDEVARPVARLLEALHDGELSARLVTELHRAKLHEAWTDRATLKAAWRVCAPDPAAFPAVVRALERIEGETGLSPWSLVDGMSAALGRGPLLLVRALLLDEDIGPLVKCGRKLAVLHALGQPLRAAASSTTVGREWIAAYPAAFHDDLAWLCEQTEQAEPLAAKLLRSIHHGTAAIDDERRAIEGLVASAAPERAQTLRARLATLERRRAAPAPTPSPEKLERLRAKLRRRGALARLEALEATADALLPAAVAEELALPSCPAWALEERVLAILVPLRKLATPIRRLARTIIHARAGAPPWDLREHRANAAFLTMLRERGLDPAPWLDGIGTIEVGQGDGRMRLALEDDPLELFHMGRHFGTCLSPGQCNFFSVFANAADVNKRVLYARDARGTVVGRRLYCLTQEGALLAFHAYCHDAGNGFAEASADFARRLAQAMGTVVVGRGNVPRLLAPDWYDDGPVDIAGQFDALKDGSSFREALLRVPPAELPALLAQAFFGSRHERTPAGASGKTKLDEVLAPMVLALPELAGRPELARPLVALVRHPERLPLQACQLLAALLGQAGAAAEAGALLAEPMATALLQQHREHRWMAFDALDELARLAPSRTLELLRRTRDRGIRSWEAELQIERLLAAGTAMEALRRPAQAIRIYRRAGDAHGYDGHKRLAWERLAALDPTATAPP